MYLMFVVMTWEDYLELCVQAEQTGVVLNQPGLFGSVQETHQQQQLLQSEARQRLLVA